MSLPPGSVIVTGASSGLGAALARRWAAPGRRLALTGRDRARLDAVAAACRADGAEVIARTLDVTDADGMAAFLAKVEEAGPVGTVVANAGTSYGERPGGAMETAEETRRQIAVNAIGVVNTVAPLIPALRARRRGRIAIIASLAARLGLASAPGYAASKAAAERYGEALRARLAADGVAVTVVSVGFFDTAMGRRFRGPKPFRWSLERAAERIGRGIERGERSVVFPAPLALGLALLPWLPVGTADAIARRFRFTVDPP